jgi:predicted transcriptional regulator
MKKDGIENVFFRLAPVNLLMEMANEHGMCYVSMLSKRADITYSHAVKLFEKMRKNGIVEFEKHGRIKQVRFTSKGSKVIDSLQRVLSVLSEKDGQNQKIKD